MHYLTIQKILKESDTALSGDQIWFRAKERGDEMARTTVSTILNKMLDKGKVTYSFEQVEDRRIKFWKPT